MHPRLWIDLDNSPHVLLFSPLISLLRKDGWEIFVTARDFAQTLDLVERMGLDAVAVGSHAGRNKVRKVANLPVRAMQLVRAVRRFAPELALSHGSRTQAIASRLLRIPQIVMFDYEWTEMRILERLARRLVCPSALTAERLVQAGIPIEKIEWYDGFKEELYLSGFVPDPRFRAELGVGDDQRLVTIRPPGLIGNYHDAGSERLCIAAIERAASDPANVVVVLPKTRVERQFISESLQAEPCGRIVIPERALPGLDLLAASDLAISGGGTMNREAALLGVMTYSIFTGRRAAVDEELVRRGLLRFMESAEEVEGIDWDVRRGSRTIAARDSVLYDISGLIHKFAGYCRRSFATPAS